MHIAYLIQQFAPEVGAGPARVTEMASRWMAEGARVTVITGMPNRPQGRIHPDYRGRLFLEEEWDGVRVLRSWLFASPKHGFARTVANNTSFMMSATLHALARVGRPDVLIASAPPFFPHIAGWITSAVRRLPLVLEFRDLWPDYLVDMGVLRRGGMAAGGLFALERMLVGRAQRSVVVTESFRQRVISKGAEPHTVSVIPNGVDLERYFRCEETPPFPEMEAASGRRIVGYLGNMGAGQGLATVLRAAKAIAGRDPNVRFVLAGDGPERRSLERLSGELRVDNVVLHDPIPKDRTRAFYNACDVCLVPLADVPIFQETVPSKIFEIMACERPVVASLGGEAARIVESSGAGVVTPPGDAAQLADAIHELLGRSEVERAEMGCNGRDFVTRHYERGRLATRYHELLMNLASLTSTTGRVHYTPVHPANTAQIGRVDGHGSNAVRDAGR